MSIIAWNSFKNSKQSTSYSRIPKKIIYELRVRKAIVSFGIVLRVLAFVELGYVY